MFRNLRIGARLGLREAARLSRPSWRQTVRNRMPSSWTKPQTEMPAAAAAAMASHAHHCNGKANGNGHDHSVALDQFVRF